MPQMLDNVGQRLLKGSSGQPQIHQSITMQRWLLWGRVSSPAPFFPWGKSPRSPFQNKLSVDLNAYKCLYAIGYSFHENGLTSLRENRTQFTHSYLSHSKWISDRKNTWPSGSFEVRLCPVASLWLKAGSLVCSWAQRRGWFFLKKKRRYMSILLTTIIRDISANLESKQLKTQLSRNKIAKWKHQTTQFLAG